MIETSAAAWTFITIFFMFRIIKAAFIHNYALGFLLPFTTYFWLMESLPAVTLVHLADCLICTEYHRKHTEEFEENWQRSTFLLRATYLAIQLGVLQFAYFCFIFFR
tara:strand:+ start:221 stop:541 length:321 start_codon:yes stop_codon:yes gene_type:complete